METEAFQQHQIRTKQADNKRKFSALSNQINCNIANSSSCSGSTESSDSFEPPAKRRQPKELFRPWLIEDNKERKQRKQPLFKPIIVQYHPNKVRTFQAKERTPKEQKRRDRNTLTCLMSRRAKKIEEQILEQEYLEYQQQLEVVERETVKSSLYLQELQRLAVAVSFPHLTAIKQHQFVSQPREYATTPTTLFVFRG